LAGFETIKPELDGLNVKILAASVDSREEAAKIQAELSFPIAHSVEQHKAHMICS
jgi:hypothetical protein